MLENVKRVHGYHLGAVDGEIGRVKDLYFDDQSWTIRYLVADTGSWLAGKQVLISPWALQRVNEADRSIETSLTRKQIEDSPPITADLPVTRQYETEYYQYYGWPMYWYGPALWGPGPVPAFFGTVDGFPSEQRKAASEKSDPHLRSTGSVIDYRIHAFDSHIGHVDDFLFDDENWAIRYLVVDSRNWWPGKKVLLSPQWIHEVSWDKSTVFADLHRETIRQAPEYDPSSRVTREYETHVFEHYKREAYWNAEQHHAGVI
jgi:hypothetical protein